MLLSYKPLHLEAQQRLQEEGCVVDIMRQQANPASASSFDAKEAKRWERKKRSLQNPFFITAQKNAGLQPGLCLPHWVPSVQL